MQPVQQIFWRAPGETSNVACLESVSYLAGSRIVPGPATIIIFTLGCYLKSRSNIGVEMRTHFIISSCVRMAKGHVIEFSPACALLDPSLFIFLFYSCATTAVRMESTPVCNVFTWIVGVKRNHFCKHPNKWC